MGPTGPSGANGLDGATGPAGATGPDGALNAWALLGNAGTVAGTNFLGTTDNTSLYLDVNSTPTLIFNTDASIQRDPSGDARGAGAVDLQMDRSSSSNVASGQDAFIGAGTSNTASGFASAAMGAYSSASGYAAFVSGYGNTASGDFSTSMGSSTTASGSSSTAIGVGASATAYGALALGVSSQATGNSSTALGVSSLASGSYATALGVSTIASGAGSTALGVSATASGANATALGTSTLAYGNYSTAFGNSTTAVGVGSMSMGVSTTAYGAASTAMGNGSVANGDYALSAGNSNLATGFVSTVFGQNNTAAGDYSSIIGGNGLTLSGNNELGYLAGNSGSNDMNVSASNVTLLGNSDVWLANNDNAARALYFYAPNSTTGDFPAGTKYTAFKAGSQSTSVTYTLPIADGSPGQVLATDGSGTLSWSSNNIGSYAHAGSADAGVTISNVAVFVIDAGSTTGNFSISLPSGINGQILYVVNNDATHDATNAAGNVAHGGAKATYVFGGGSWH